MKSCDTCEFWLAEEPATDNPEDEKVGVCRRYPPLGAVPPRYWTVSNHWCGEWKQRDDVA